MVEVDHKAFYSLIWMDWEKLVLHWPVFCKESQGFNWIAHWLWETQIAIVMRCHSKEDGKSYDSPLPRLSFLLVQLVWLGSKSHGVYCLHLKRRSRFYVSHTEQRSTETIQVPHLLSTDRILHCEHCLAAVLAFQMGSVFSGQAGLLSKQCTWS